MTVGYGSRRGSLRSPGHLAWQTLALLLAWLYLCGLQPDNDGLWFQGDAPRHAINGFFWIDYLRDFTLDPTTFALSYYARYPAIDPASRPPVFYLIEGTAYQLFGPTSFVAKGVVLGFALVAAFYVMAWLRRWTSKGSGYAAAAFLLLPAMVTWSHAVMLNVPSLAFGLAALYHARCWIEQSRKRDLALSAMLTVLGILTYYQTGAVLFVMACWLVIGGHLKKWAGREMFAAILVCGVVLLPFIWLIARWAPLQLDWVFPDTSTLTSMKTWTYYPRRIPALFPNYLLGLAAIGTIGGLVQPRWRRETAFLVSWIAVLYVVFGVLHAKDLRYALPAIVPLMCLSVIGVYWCGLAVTARLGLGLAAATRITAAGLLAVITYQAYAASKLQVPSVSGFRELVSFLDDVGADETLFYDGYYDGVFTFLVRAGDENFDHRVVIGNKMLFSFATLNVWQSRDFAESPEQAIEILRKFVGCRWVAIEYSTTHGHIYLNQHLREAVKSPAFELIRSFAITAPVADRVDLYQLKLPVEEVREVEMRLRTSGAEATYHVRPIPPRRVGRVKQH